MTETTLGKFVEAIQQLNAAVSEAQRVADKIRMSSYGSKKHQFEMLKNGRIAIPDELLDDIKGVLDRVAGLYEEPESYPDSRD